MLMMLAGFYYFYGNFPEFKDRRDCEAEMDKC